uniref:Uncharacterized protein n=1 Tax=viral metagenome TaxID=1070528 RepID=A0A6M3JZK7_9ZZZZ
MAEKFKVTIKCWNCGVEVTIELEKNHLVMEARATTECTNCGCNLNATVR